MGLGTFCPFPKLGDPHKPAKSDPVLQAPLLWVEDGVGGGGVFIVSVFDCHCSEVVRRGSSPPCPTGRPSLSSPCSL